MHEGNANGSMPIGTMGEWRVQSITPFSPHSSIHHCAGEKLNTV